MAQQTVQVTLLDDVYHRLKVRAEEAQYSVEDELVTLAAAALDDEPMGAYAHGNRASMGGSCRWCTSAVE
jgi:plasmid stability protein